MGGANSNQSSVKWVEFALIVCNGWSQKQFVGVVAEAVRSCNNWHESALISCYGGWSQFGVIRSCEWCIQQEPLCMVVE